MTLEIKCKTCSTGFLWAAVCTHSGLALGGNFAYQGSFPIHRGNLSPPFPYITFLLHLPLIKADGADVLSFPRQIDYDTTLNLPHALILVQVELPCNDSANGNRLSLCCAMTALYAYINDTSSRIVFSHICYVLLKHIGSHLDLLRASKCNLELQADH